MKKHLVSSLIELWTFLSLLLQHFLNWVMLGICCFNQGTIEWIERLINHTKKSWSWFKWNTISDKSGMISISKSYDTIQNLHEKFDSTLSFLLFLIFSELFFFSRVIYVMIWVEKHIQFQFYTFSCSWIQFLLWILFPFIPSSGILWINSWKKFAKVWVEVWSREKIYCIF